MRTVHFVMAVASLWVMGTAISVACDQFKTSTTCPTEFPTHSSWVPPSQMMSPAFPVEQSDILEARGEAAYPSNMPRAQARIMARRAAIADAQRNLLESLMGVYIDSETMTSNSAPLNDRVRMRAQGLLRGATIVHERDKSDSYEVVMRLRLSRTGLPSRSTFPEHWTPLPSGGQVHTSVREPVNIPSYLPPRNPLPIASDPTRPYTGVVIDARGLGLERTMTLKIRRTDGSEVWGTLPIDPDYLLRYGMASYLPESRASLLAQAGVRERIGENPLVIHAIGVAGRARTDPIVSEADAQRLLHLNQYSRLLDDLRIVIVY